MGELLDGRPRFARVTAQACMDLWNRTQTMENVARLGEEHEEEIVKQIEQLQLERMLGEDA